MRRRSGEMEWRDSLVGALRGCACALAFVTTSCSNRPPPEPTPASTALVETTTTARWSRLGIGAKELPTAVIRVNRWPCYGTCPVYYLELQANGYGVFVGELFVAHEGHNDLDFEPRAFTELLDRLETLDFLALPESHITGTNDSWETEVELSIAGRPHRVWVNQLKDESANLALMKFADLATERSGAMRWIGTDAERGVAFEVSADPEGLDWAPVTPPSSAPIRADAASERK